MRSNWSCRVKAALVIVAALCVAHCGKFGQKDDLGALLQYAGSTGCLNQMGPQFEAYYQGNIDAADWSATWDCAINSLKLVQQYFRGSGDDGAFTQGDMKSFISM